MGILLEEIGSAVSFISSCELPPLVGMKELILSMRVPSKVPSTSLETRWNGGHVSLGFEGMARPLPLMRTHWRGSSLTMVEDMEGLPKSSTEA